MIYYIINEFMYGMLLYALITIIMIQVIISITIIVIEIYNIYQWSQHLATVGTHNVKSQFKAPYVGNLCIHYLNAT